MTSPLTYDQIILCALSGKTMYVRIPFFYPHQQERLRDHAVREVMTRLKRPLGKAVLKFSKNDIQFRSGGRIMFVVDRREGGHWMEQEWARGITWDGGLIAYWPDEKEPPAQ